MRIHSKNTSTTGLEMTPSSPQPDSGASAVVGPVATARLSIDQSEDAPTSDICRALTARGGDRFVADLEPAHAASVRARIMSGAFNTVQVVDAVARRLLASGDL